MKQIIYANPSREREFSPKRRERKKMIRTALALIGAAAVLAAIWTAARAITLRPAEETAEEEAVSVGVGRALAGIREQEIETAERERLENYTEGEGPAPEWYNPTEPMAAEWEADKNADISQTETDNSRTIRTENCRQDSCGQVTEANEEAVSRDIGVFCGEAEQVTDKNAYKSRTSHVQTRTTRTDIGCPDWNLCSTLYGWDGHTAEPWEMELYTRIVYLEFWGTSAECCEAGADSILRLWDSGYYGDTLGELLSARAEDGSLVYSPYAYVWDWDYDPEGLEEMRDLCNERFYGGPKWEAPFFRLWYYHPWAVPMYEIDGVYFSTGEGW